MKPVFQTLTRPALSRAMAETGFHCYEACVASILELDPMTLPANWLAKPTREYWRDLEAAMAELRYRHWWQPADGWPGAGGWCPAGYSILTGRSPRNPQLLHSVVYLDGELVHDPMPGGRGVAWPIDWSVWIPDGQDLIQVLNYWNDAA